MKQRVQKREQSFGQGLELIDIAAKAIATAAKNSDVESDFIQKIIGKPQAIFDFYKKLFKGEEPDDQSSGQLILMSQGESPLIEELDCSMRFSAAHEFLRPYDDGIYDKYNLNHPAKKKTPKTFCDVYKTTFSSSYRQIFATINENLDRLVLSQHQILWFCRKYPFWLFQGASGDTAFLIKVHNGGYQVVCVSNPIASISGSDNVYWFTIQSLERNPDCLYNRIVVPQIK
ncbi:MAG: hypothetical protein ACM3PZ_00605 [Bacillota bacterium]